MIGFSFVYSKYFGDVFYPRYGGDWEGERGVAMYTVRALSMELIGGSTIVGRLAGKRFRSYQGEFGTRFKSQALQKLLELADILYEPEELKQFEPMVWHVGGQLEGIIAFSEKEAVVAAYNHGLRCKESSKWNKYYKPWKGLIEYQKGRERLAV